MASVTLEGISKIYPGGQAAVSALDLVIEDGEFLVVVGPSGCGKSTALRMVAGLEEITEGTLRIGERVVNDLPPKERDVAMVFQSYALYPHMTVGQNIAFALKIQGLRRDEVNARVQKAARTLQLEPLLDRKPSQLSGGQRQRVAMGRAIVRDPAVFLMDEPLSNLDAKLRVQMRAEIAQLQRELKTTTLYVTHDQTEAMTMGDRVAVLRDGVLQQVATPEHLYTDPDNLFVAAFIGSPSMNLLNGTTVPRDGAVAVRVGDQEMPLPRHPNIEPGRDVVVGIRPEALSDPAADAVVGAGRLRAEVELREALGPELLVHLRIAAPPAVTDETRQLAADVDSAAIEALEQQATHGEAVIVARFDPRSRVHVGDVVELAVDLERVHLFDPTTALSIRP